jgi:hypothetical protein
MPDGKTSTDEDAAIFARYGAWYMRCGPAHLTPETCAAIERHLDSTAQKIRGPA